MLQCIQRVLCIALQWGNERSNLSDLKGIWKARRQVSQIHVKGNSKIIWPFAHILMYVVLGVKPAYIREKGIKSHIWQLLHVFRDDIRNIKGTKMVHGV